MSYNWRDIVEEDHVFASEADYYAYIDSLEAQNFNVYDTYITEYVSMDVSEAVSSDENPYLTPTALFSQGGKTETTATAAEPSDAETETTTETTEAVAVPDDTSGTQHETGEVHAYISYQRFDYAHVTHHRLYPYRARGEGRHLSGGVLHESASGKQAASDLS